VTASGTWVTIYGENLASTTRPWGEADFAGDLLPIELDGVSVLINDKNAFLSYISPTQVNVLCPDDDSEGQVPVQIVTRDGVSDPAFIEIQSRAPAFFTFSGGGGMYISAVHADGTYLAPPGLIPDAPTRPAAPGEIILLFANGFGRTAPKVGAGELIRSAVTVDGNVTVWVGATPATVLYAGLVMPGLYQLNVVVPHVADGDYPIWAEVEGFRTADGVLLSVAK
jgi:uncharacterized protein (TIGR03437 family)